ncbi:hypothetical protein CMUS01_08915 [Colletotrichum musicola]|uniref:Secreted protein n=1 Tax=Colletotrichum musicola TaxID=2175873 RepID=A0A8H6KAN1_9PEZI|nr:hypothetical protein CMUS01_08915 [Colletotrichum musicola]
MVNFALSALAALALAQLTGAAPTQKEETVELFSFGKWVDGIIANPDGNNLTPEEAVKAWKASINETAAAADGENALQKRYACNTRPNNEASVPDAVWCINDIARRGSAPCSVPGIVDFCIHGNARVWGARGGAFPTSSACNDVARGAGFVMDHCTRADNTVQGNEFAYGNGNLLVWITRP